MSISFWIFQSGSLSLSGHLLIFLWFEVIEEMTQQMFTKNVHKIYCFADIWKSAFKSRNKVLLVFFLTC